MSTIHHTYVIVMSVIDLVNRYSYGVSHPIYLQPGLGPGGFLPEAVLVQVRLAIVDVSLDHAGIYLVVCISWILLYSNDRRAKGGVLPGLTNLGPNASTLFAPRSLMQVSISAWRTIHISSQLFE